MRVSEFLEPEEFVPFFVCVYLISILAWRFLPRLTNVPGCTSILEAARSSFDGSKDSRTSRRDSRGNQFLARAALENECNYVDSVPVLQSQPAIREYLREIVEREVRNHFLRNNHEIPRNICDASSSIRSDTSIENEASMESLGIEDSSDDCDPRMNLENTENSSERRRSDTVVEENTDRSIAREESFEENLATLSSTDAETERSEEKFSDDEAASERSYNDSRDEYAKYPDRKNGDAPSKVEENYSLHKFAGNFEIEKSNPNESSEERSTVLKIKTEERPETRTSRSLLEKYSAGLRVNNNTERESFGEEIIISEECTTKEDFCDLRNNFPGEETQKNGGEPSPDESRSKMDVHGSVERLSPAKDPKICSRPEEDRLDEQFGVFSEKGRNCMEVKSIMHSSKDALRSREEEKEGKIEFGPPPERNSLKNGREAESTICLARASATSRNKDEEGLNAMIRRMIIIELKRHCQRQEATLKRAYSDTESVLPLKRSSVRNRTVLLNVDGRTFLRDFAELEESLRKYPEDRSVDESTKPGFEEKRVAPEDSTSRGANDSKIGNVPDSSADRSKPSANFKNTSCTIESNIVLERKMNAACMIDVETTKLFGTGEALEARKQEYASKSTQTEHVYVIHAVRSCPLRKRHPPLQLQLRRVSLGRGAVSSKTVYASRDFPEFIFRKASDNLIYEKGKGSRSPSFVATPERFRWRYVTPTNVK